jgi:hypothetical protein
MNGAELQTTIVRALAAVWLVLFLISFVMLQVTEPSGAGPSQGLNRIAAFMTWQGVALVIAAVGALNTRRVAEQLSHQTRLVGYVPLAVSVFLVATLVAIIAYRVLVRPIFV